MGFANVPNVSRKQISRAGDLLISDNYSQEEYDDALELVNQWRACHAYPINTFQSLLRKRIREGNYGGGPIVAQRLKRLPTIIDKLKRFSDMNLTTMQDIGGLRAILDSVDDVYRLRDEYIHGKFAHIRQREDDYIAYPRSHDGYRSLHLTYKYKNYHNPSYDGLRVELQFRTKLQHLWATAVETMDTFLGEKIKYRQGSRGWTDFFAATSSAFSFIENTAQVPRYNNLSCKETYDLVANINKKIDAVQKMNGLSAAVSVLSETKGYVYHLILLNSLENKVEIINFDRDSFEDAIRVYDQVEKGVLQGEKIEPVLVSAGKIDMVRKAYPNFFLDISDFLLRVREIIKE